MLELAQNTSALSRGESTTNQKTTTGAPPSQWFAYLNLQFSQTARGVRLVKNEHLGPLYIQKPFYPEGTSVPHIYLLHPPGGLVSGDHLKIDIAVDKQCNALVTTPGAGRLYKARADGSPQKQSFCANIADGASFEYLPLEAIAFPSTNAQLDNQFRLHGSGKLIYWDVLSLGLPANQETFSSGAFNQNTRVYLDNRLVLQERFVINDTNRNLLTELAGLQNNPVQGLLIAGPFIDDTDTLIEQIREKIAACDFNAGVSLVDQFIIIRTLNGCSESARQLFEHCWASIRPALVQRPACAPRIWRT